MEIKKHGGRRPGAGRKPGTVLKKTVDRFKRTEQIFKAVEKAIPDAFVGDAHAFLTAVYKNPEAPFQARLQAAIAAIPFEKPRLAAVKHFGEEETAESVRNRIEVIIVDPAGGSAPRVPALIEASPV